MERKVHYKSYKSGKFWVAALISVSLGTVGVITIPQIFEAVPVYADASPTDVTATVDPNDFLNYFKLGGSTGAGKQPAIPYPAGQQGYQVQLTADAQGQAGNVALKTKIDMTQSFTLTGRLYLGKNASGGDGVAFGFADANPGDIGQPGNAFGIGGLPRAFGVKFDEYYNGGGDKYAAADLDPGDYPQMRVVHTGPGDNPTQVVGVKGAKGVFYNNIPAPNGQHVDLVITYDGQTKQMTVKYGTVGITFDAGPYIKNEQLAMFLTGSTGGVTNQHLFDFLKFTYTPGLKAVQADLKNRLLTEANTQKAAVNADPTLTTDDRKSQTDKIDVALKTGQDAIDAAATTPDAINAFDTNKPKIIAVHTPGQPLADRKADRKAKLQAEHDKIVKDINSDPTLTAAEKTQQITNADTALSNANTKVDAATDADNVDLAFSNGKAAIDAAHKPGATLDAQRTAKKAALDTEAATIKQAIQDDATLTSAEKKTQSDAVDKALTDAKSAIDNATTADTINAAADTGLANIRNAHQSGPSLADQRTIQKQALKAKHDQVVNDITLDPTLTAAEKKTQITNADQALTDGNAAIDTAATADAINQAATVSQANIDNAHKVGKPLEDQKNAQRQRLNNEATAVKKKIQDDVTLTTAEKTQQTANVDKALTDGLNAVNNATTADGIIAAGDDGIAAIDKVYQTGTPLDDQKTAKKTAIDNAAAIAKKAIQDDPTLTTAEKKLQTDAVDKAVTDGKKAIDAATNADDVNKAANTAIATINQAHQPGKSIDDQKDAKKKAIDKAATDTKKAIQDDPTLTTAEKQQQSDAVDKAADAGKKAVDAATNADDINTAGDTAITDIGKIHQPGKSINEQKDAKKTELDNEAAKIKTAIQGDPTLTTDEKNKQLDAVDKALEAGKKAIDAATNADDINTAADTAKTNIDNAHQPGTSIDDQKKAQKEALAKEATTVKEAIQNDPTLTTAEKQQQTDNVDKALKDAEAAIDNATTADEINTATATGKTNIDNAHKPGTSLDDQKVDQKKKLEDEAAAVKKAIQDDPTLTTAEKQQQTANVDKALKDAEDAIDAATNADGVNQAFSDGKAKIDAAHQPGQTLDDQKATQKKALEDEAATVKKAIQDDPTLTTAEKQQQTDNVDKALKDAKDAIDAAKDADSINQAFSDGKQTIDAAHQPGKTLDDQKAAQKKALEDEAAAVKKAIQDDPTLTTTEKQQQTADVDQALKDGTAAITNATNADEVNQAFNTGKTNIDNAHQPSISVDDQKANQKKALDDIAATVKKAIQDDPTLTTAEKQQQTTNVDKALKDAKDAIDAAKDADSINQAFSDGKTNIENAHQPGQTLDDQKNNQKKALDDEATKIKQAIQDDPTLTTAEKNQQIAEVDKAVKEGKAAIDAGTNADEINKAFTDAKNNVDQAHKPGKAVDDQKDAQKKLLDDEATKVKQAIQDDPTLTTAEKQQQTDNVDKALKDGKAAIDAAKNADEINQAFDTGKTNIDNAHQPGASIDDQKAAQKKSLADEAAKVKKEIQDDPTLTTAEKQQQSENVDKALKDGEAAIDAAKNADEINQAFDTGKVNIDNAHQPGTNLDDQKAAQKKSLADEAAKVKQEIQDDPTLTTAEKNQQTANVDQALKDGEAAIDAAKNADEVNDAFNTGKINIDNAHQPGKTIDEQQTLQKKSLNDEAAKVTQEIQNDPTLTTAEKQKQIQDVADALKAGEAAIDAATTADEVNQAFDTGKINIDNAHKPGTAVNDQKEAQKKSLAEEAAKVKQEIQDDPTLTTAEKNQQTANVDQAFKNGEAAIDAATNADDINKAFDIGKINIDNAHQPGKSIDDQKNAQKKLLDEEAAKVKQDIQNDPTLTAVEKQQQRENVDKALKDGNAAIDAATNADDINHAFETGKVNIDNAHQPGKTLDEQKTVQKKSLDEEAAKVKQDIQNDPTLTTTEKQQQAENVDKARKDGQAAIDAATNADDINHAFETGKVNIDNAHQPGKTLDEQKTVQKKSLDEEAAKVKQDIQNDPTLTTTEKQQQAENVDKAHKDGQAAIDAATTPDEVNQAFATGKANIDAQHQPGKSLADQRSTATTKIDKEAAKVKQQIDNDPLLTDTEKANQKAKADHEATLAKEALAKAIDADALNAALADGIKKIDAQYVPGTAKTPTPDPATKPLTVDPRSTTTRPLSTTLTPTSSLPRTGDKPATGLAALGAFILSMFGFALTGKKRKRS
ncbi:DUF1542 domain-containing protein [Lacticaseibacillus casei]|nr:MULTISPECIES: DUF1542 domain-containing protein [Lacticaseibacillus]QXG58542.1 DUF1542 domain-containing protein [Lacticaseibacillus casei]WFB41716.1 DUF1542 domain-containing protein [Lacticaseibacillus huelsenbergensis]